MRDLLFVGVIREGRIKHGEWSKLCGIESAQLWTRKRGREGR
jgi:hypothetical protein